ncbi:hypothetical protein BH23ACT11_BH23ACT11_01840 [soil metagenome]
MAGWGKLVAGAVIGIAGTVFATNEEARKKLPKSARELPDAVRRRFGSAISAAREASSSRREEILRDLEAHGGDHSDPAPERQVEADPEPEAARGPLHEDDTQQLYRPVEDQT